VVENDQRATVSVRNDGKPIPPGEFESIFQQFVRSNSTGETTTPSWGVGLPYVRQVAESHGGSALVFSDDQSGNTFVIDMPLDARPFQQG
jgi:signal transduction histidine kinase